MLITTGGDFRTSYRQGTFEIAGQYQGTFHRQAVSETNFSADESLMGELTAEITRTDNGKTWLLNCYGAKTDSEYEQAQVSVPGFNPYQCDIDVAGERVGVYEIAMTNPTLYLNIIPYESGIVRIGDNQLTVRSVHQFEGAALETSTPLGYVFNRGHRTVAAAQDHNITTLQMLPELTEDEKDLIVVGTVASVFSWRPEE